MENSQNKLGTAIRLFARDALGRYPELLGIGRSHNKHGFIGPESCQ
jgi:hypothetical protein